MRHLLVLLVAVATVAGCAKSGAPVAASAGGPGQAKSSEANRFLAYEHSIHLQADDDKVVPIFEAAQAACRDAVEDSCAILNAQVSSGDSPSASLRFRARASGIQKLIAVLSKQGEIASQSTSAEDLAGPIADTTKQIALLTSYRSSLEALRNRPSNDLDSLMKLTRELADVQSQLETLTGAQAGLTQRVETELLNVSINSYHRGSFWGTIAESTTEFGDVLSSAIAGVILAVAYLLPWAVVIGAIAWIARAVLRWRKRRRAQA